MHSSSLDEMRPPHGKALARDFARRMSRAVPGLDSGLDPLLACYFPPSGDSGSGLNHDGSALQLCLVLRETATGWRAILDPGLGTGSAGQRYTRARRALANDLAGQGAQAAQPLFDHLLDSCGPDTACPASAFGQGVFWLGAELGGPGRAVYIDASVRSAAETWARAEAAFLALAGASGDIAITLAALAAVATPSSIGLEVRGSRRRLKLHCRFFAVPGGGVLAAALPMLAHHPILSALAALMKDDQGLSLHGLVVEAAFDAETGLLSDAKLDLALPELCPPARALDRAIQAAAALGLDWPQALALSVSACARLSYVGIGRAADSSMRMNLYFKPWSPDERV